MWLSMTAEAEMWHTQRSKTAGKLREPDWTLSLTLLVFYAHTCAAS
jgi:hypothetical protein